VQAVCTQGLNLFRSLIVYMDPVLPRLGLNVRALFGEPAWTWQSAATPLLERRIAAFKPLLNRLEPRQIDRMVEQSKA
jgi:methionyl-tRNA synthetase